LKKTPLYKLDLDVYHEQLENGLNVYIIPKNDINNIYTTFSTNYGSIQNEFIPNEQNDMVRVPDGIAHFLEHKVFEQKDEIDPFEFFGKSGTDCNANTSQYKTTYLFVGQDNFNDNINYLLDFVQDPYFTEQNVEKEKGIIEQEINMYADDPMSCGYESIVYNSFINHPIKESIAGTVESIRKITKEDLYTCYNTFYHPSNMFVVITGNVDPLDTINIIKENQTKKPYKKQQEIVIKEYEEPNYVSKEFDLKNMNVTIPKVLISFKLNVDNIDLDKRSILNYIGIYADLKFGQVSLFSEYLKQKKLITNDIEFSTLKTNKHVLLILEIETEKPEDLIKEIDKEILIYSIDEKEFNRKKKTAISSCIYMSDSIFRLNSLIMNDVIEYKKFNTDIYKHYQSLNFQDFDKMIKKLDFKNKTTFIINPKK